MNLLSLIVTTVLILGGLSQKSVAQDTPVVAGSKRDAPKPEVVVGSKRFTESYILAEIMAQLLESKNFRVQRQFGLAGTSIALKALQEAQVQVYPEYTGTIAAVVFQQSQSQSLAVLNRRLEHIQFLKAFGFENTYVFVTTPNKAQQYHLKRISDLHNQPLKAALTHEFLNRADGWPAFKKVYDLRTLKVKGFDHALAYEALVHDKVDVMEAYSTDAKLKLFQLVALKDNKQFFPLYQAAPLAHPSLPAEAQKTLNLLHNTISTPHMISMNHKATVEKQSFAKVAHEFLLQKKLVAAAPQAATQWWKTFWQHELWGHVGQHLWLAFLPILAALLLSLPLGMILQKYEKLAQAVLGAASLLQVIPSLALLVLMIPYFGTGVWPAMMALFLYAILPILRNTYVGLANTDPQLLSVARGIGLYNYEVLWLIRLPLALPFIVAGVRTAAVINIGLATIAAFIGAGGLGEPIVTGLALNDVNKILQGAVPAALLAIVVELIFERLEKLLRQ